MLVGAVQDERTWFSGVVGPIVVGFSRGHGSHDRACPARVGECKSCSTEEIGVPSSRYVSRKHTPYPRGVPSSGHLKSRQGSTRRNLPVGKMSRVRVRVRSHEVCPGTRPGTSPFACYTLEISTESGVRYSIRKRWNDLRQCEDALRVDYDLKQCRRVEAHSWRQLTGGALDADFLEERSEQMESVVADWLSHFGDVLLDEPNSRGPGALLNFLSRRTPNPGPSPTPGGFPIASSPSNARAALTPVRLQGIARPHAQTTPSATVVLSSATGRTALTPQSEEEEMMAAKKRNAAARAFSLSSNFTAAAGTRSFPTVRTAGKSRVSVRPAQGSGPSAGIEAKGRSSVTPSSIGSWSVLLLWTSLVLLPLLAVLAKHYPRADNSSAASPLPVATFDDVR